MAWCKLYQPIALSKGFKLELSTIFWKSRFHIEKRPSFKWLVFLKENFEFPPTVTLIVVIFQYVVADIILYSKSLGSAQTVKFWPRTSSLCGTPAGISSCRPCPCLYKSSALGCKNAKTIFLFPIAIFFQELVLGQNLTVWADPRLFE